MTDFIKQSKLLHRKLEAKTYWQCACIVDNNDDTRRHHAMLDESFLLLSSVAIKSCLSIGDSRARDAAYAKHFFGCHAIASDLNTECIGEAVKDGFVDAVADVDVENIPFEDSSIDLVLGKETFHHWPRPMLGLYEMIRVAKKAVILIEPYDCVVKSATPYVNEDQYHDSYEEVGNYKYQISLREILKAAWAMGLPAVSAKGFNDPYQPNQLFTEWLEKKKELDRLGAEDLRQFNLMAVAIYKNSEDAETQGIALPKTARLYRRPFNPYGNN